MVLHRTNSATQLGGGGQNPGLRSEDMVEFLQDLRVLLETHNLIDLLGLRWLDHDTAEPGVEFTSGTANITVPRGVFNNDQGRNVEALWLFNEAVETAPGVTALPTVCMGSCVVIDGKYRHTP